jgi:membrane fusion protein, multidrug efflux system
MPYDEPQSARRAGGDAGHAAAGEDDKGQESRRWLVPLIAGAVVLVAAIGGVAWWLATKDQASTDDAFTDGRAVMIAPKVGGYVAGLLVGDNQLVHAGDALLRIDPRDLAAARDQARGQREAAQGQLAAARAALAVAGKTFPARLEAARARRLAAQASLDRAQADYRRQTGLARGATTQQSIDEATAALRQAESSVAQADAEVAEAGPMQENIDEAAARASQLEGAVAVAQAQLDQAELNLSYAVVRAPEDGWVTKRNVERGNLVSAGTTVMSLVSPAIWVTANFKENQLNRMRPGQRVTMTVDSYPSLKLRGHVDSIQRGTGSRFSAFPAENATGNYVKIVQRVPVKIVIDAGLDPNLAMPLGLSVEPTVDLRSAEPTGELK